MMKRCLGSFAAFLVACGSSGDATPNNPSNDAGMEAGSPTPDAASGGFDSGALEAGGGGSDSGHLDSGNLDSGNLDSGGLDAGADAQACVPTAGSANLQVSCDSLQLAVMTYDGAPTTLLLMGRLGSGNVPACAVIDGVDVLSGNQVVQHLAGGASVLLNGNDEQELARVTSPAADILHRCASDDPRDRYDVYGIRVTGRADGGTFTAKCAAASAGVAFPPELRLTCHRNVQALLHGGSANVEVLTFQGTTSASASLSAYGPTSPGTLDGTLRIIAKREPFDPNPPIAPRDSTGWTGSVGSSPSRLDFTASSDALGTDVCPGQNSGSVAPPVFIARATGNAGGPISTEMFITSCSRHTQTVHGP